MTRVVHEQPPNIEAIRAVFGPLEDTVVFAYGDTIYAPGGFQPSPDLIVHEETHFEQQAEVGGPEAWWGRYLTDPEWRLAQEVEAYRRQLASIPDRQHRKAVKAHVVKALASRMYGNLVTKTEARNLLSSRRAAEEGAP